MNVKLWLAPALLALLVAVAGCSDDDIVASSGSLMVRGASGIDVEIQGVTWVEACHEQDPGVYITASMQLGQTGTRTETQFSDAACTAQTGQVSFALTLTNDGNRSAVWSDDASPFNPAPPPTNFLSPHIATKVTIGISGGGVPPDSFMTLLTINDIASPRLLYFGNDENGTKDADGYPDYIVNIGIPEQ